jgi:hypothetical protein
VPVLITDTAVTGSADPGTARDIMVTASTAGPSLALSSPSGTQALAGPSRRQ